MTTIIRLDELAALAREGLRQDGDMLTLPDGRRLRLTVERDDCTSINDFDCYGKADKFSHDWRDMQRPRPEGFTGAARRLEIDRGVWIWWEPYRDESKVYDSPEDVRLARDLLHYGFSRVGVMVLEPLTDSQGRIHWCEVDSKWLHGIDDATGDYLAEVVADLTWEVLDD